MTGISRHLCYKEGVYMGVLDMERTDQEHLDLIYINNIFPRLQEITAMREQGFDMSRIAMKLKISSTQFRLLLRKKQELYNAWYDGEVGLLEKLENSLCDEAIGRYVENTEETILYDAEGNITGRKVVKKKTWKPANAAVLKMGLEALHKNKWSGQDINHEIEIVLPKQLMEYAN